MHYHRGFKEIAIEKARGSQPLQLESKLIASKLLLNSAEGLGSILGSIMEKHKWFHFLLFSPYMLIYLIFGT